MTVRLVVLGYYGFGNFGDELILEAIQDELRTIQCEAIFVVNNPTQYKPVEGSRYSFVDRHDTGGVQRAVRRCDYIMLGGGGLIQDATTVRSSLYYLGIPLLARLYGKGLISYGQGIGPLKSPLIRWLVRMVFRRMVLIDVRDEASAHLLRSCGIDTKEISVSSDVGLSLLLAQRKNLSLVPPRRPRVLAAVNARFGWTAEEAASFLDCLASHYDAEIGLVVLFPSADETYTHEIQDRLLTPSEIIGFLTAQQLVELCASATVTVAGRYHMVAAGIASGSPVVALAYDSKVSQLATLCRLTCINPGTPPQEAARQALSSPQASADSQAVQHVLEARTARIERLRKLLEQPGR
ncbi:MAG: polysaccharide pyruvyl transferase family protein [Candidatus Cryosericum sp.]|nr:polysaccharide pyruvyl transferase family protein [bacterium]